MNTVQYMNIRQISDDGMEVEFICRDANGKIRRPRVWLDTSDFRVLVNSARTLRSKQEAVARGLLDRAKSLTDAGLAP